MYKLEKKESPQQQKKPTLKQCQLQASSSYSAPIQCQGMQKPMGKHFETVNSRSAQTEREAVTFGSAISQGERFHAVVNNNAPIQRKVGFEWETDQIETKKNSGSGTHQKGTVLKDYNDFQLTTDEGQNGSQLEIIIKPIDESDDTKIKKLLEQTVPYIGQVVTNINEACYLKWNNEISGISEKDNLYLSHRHGLDIAGQLQMSAGLQMKDLYSFASGERTVENNDYILQHYMEPNANLTQYAKEAIEEENNFSSLVPEQKNMLAAIISCMAIIIYNAYSSQDIPYPKAAAGAFLARTDYSKILKLLPNQVLAGLNRNKDMLGNLIIGTLNKSDRKIDNLTLDSSIFPQNRRFGNGVTLDKLSIGQWTKSAIPTPGIIWGYWQGKDLLTKKNFPDNKDWLESLGGYGNKTDPGNKPIFEFRMLSMVYLDSLDKELGVLFHYLKNN